MTFKERVCLHEFQLNDTDDSIIEYIINNNQDILQLPIQRIASELFISPNAIMRLTKKLGYRGYAELKYLISKEKNANEYKKENFLENMNRLPKNISRTLDIVDDSILDQIVKRMIKSSCCMFAGVGDSTYFCEMMGKNLRCLSFKAEYYQHIHDMFYYVSHCSENDTIIIISASGETKRICELAIEAKKKNAFVISITHLCKNTLAEIADINLYFWGEKRIANGYNVTDRSGLMLLLRLLSEKFWVAYCV